MKKEKPWELMRTQLLFGHVGRFSKQKNQSFLIDIFNEYQENYSFVDSDFLKIYSYII